ncbi:hypothetical protein C8F01DRAFT_1265314 [Mycena amicta]|nr:hypothetical protein C8F01DRAFT_1265314 [Mycena amicta]
MANTDWQDYVLDIALRLVSHTATLVAASMLLSPSILTVFDSHTKSRKEYTLSFSHDRWPGDGLFALCFLVAVVARFLRLLVVGAIPRTRRPENRTVVNYNEKAAFAVTRITAAPFPSPNGPDTSKNYTCIDCPDVFTNANALRQHMQTAHQFGRSVFSAPAPLQLACVDCPATFRDKFALMDHLEEVHYRFPQDLDFFGSDFDVDTPMECSVPGCGIWFLTSALDDHNLDVHGISPNMSVNKKENSSPNDAHPAPSAIPSLYGRLWRLPSSNFTVQGNTPTNMFSSSAYNESEGSDHDAEAGAEAKAESTLPIPKIQGNVGVNAGA